MEITKAIIPVAGFGTRMLPITKSIPKEMLPLGSKPTLAYIIEEAYNSGITDILLITSSYKKCIEDYFDKNFELETTLEQRNKVKELEIIKNIKPNLNIYFIRQGEPLGSGHAIKLAKSFVGTSPFAVMFGDDVMESEENPALKQLIELYKKTNSCIIGTQEVKKEDVSKYGIIEYSDKKAGRIKQIVEKPKMEETPSTTAGLGRYILTKEIFDYIDIVEPAKGEYQLPDAMHLMMKDNYPFYACKIKATYFDTGSKKGYFNAFNYFASKEIK
ncbi:MAG: UTP--glucose-1-phosphate uridylyltransferase [bacterium]|nr:UTP--glucose-1-phosphate uridylyltransferase [bacterium]